MEWKFNHQAIRSSPFWLESLTNSTERLTPPFQSLVQSAALLVALQKDRLPFSNLTHLPLSQLGTHISVSNHQLSLVKPWTLRQMVATLNYRVVIPRKTTTAWLTAWTATYNDSESKSSNAVLNIWVRVLEEPAWDRSAEEGHSCSPHSWDIAHAGSLLITTEHCY